MIEPNNPEIDVDELMQLVQQEAANHQQQSDDVNYLAVRAKIYTSGVEALVNAAESKSHARTEWPNFLNRFPFNRSHKLRKLLLKLVEVLFRDQRQVNLSLIQAFRETLALNQYLVEHLMSSQALLQTSVREETDALKARLTHAEEHINTLVGCFNANTQRAESAEAQVRSALEHVGALEQHLQHYQQQTDQSLQANVQVLQQSLQERTQALQQSLEQLLSQVQINRESAIRHITHIRTDLLQQKQLTALLLSHAPARDANSGSEDAHPAPAIAQNATFDAFYTALEEQFRGSYQTILDRLKVYLPILEKSGKGTAESPVVDLGCGRGEWLELLAKTGYVAKGVDLNRLALESCRTRTLDVIEADALAYLKGLPDASVGIVTGLHLIEHLPFPVLFDLFTEVWRVLQTGGIVIFETPNPQNVLVGTSSFYIDPTHARPLPSPLIQFLAQYMGFEPVEVLHLHPYDDSYLIQGAEAAERFNQYFYGPQDYAVIGYKP